MPKRPKPIELKWPVWTILAVCILPALLWTYNGLNEAYWHTQYIKLGKSVDCSTRPSPDYLRFCNPTSDGIACTEESTTRMIEWHSSIDYVCAQYEPDRRFRFIGYNQPQDVVVADAG